MVARMTERLVSAKNFTGEFSSSRSARMATCSPDSSPEIYSTLAPCASRSAICKNSVDLPMPGSPPASTTLPATMPPPSTRSSSPMPVFLLGAFVPAISRSCTDLPGAAPDAPEPMALRCAGAASAGRCSSSVFQLPQFGHLPIHLAHS